MIAAIGTALLEAFFTALDVVEAVRYGVRDYLTGAVDEDARW